jgi:hypothetical protein
LDRLCKNQDIKGEKRIAEKRIDVYGAGDKFLGFLTLVENLHPPQVNIMNPCEPLWPYIPKHFITVHPNKTMQETEAYVTSVLPGRTEMNDSGSLKIRLASQPAPKR